MRLVQFHEKAVDPPGDARSDLQFAWDLGHRLKALYAGSTDPKDRPILDMTWDYEVGRPARARRSASPTSRRSCARSTASPSPTGEHVQGFRRTQGRRHDRRRARGSTRATSRRRRKPHAPAQGRRLGLARVGVGVADEPPQPLQPRLGRSRRQAVERAQEVRLVGRRRPRSGPATTCPDFPGRQTARRSRRDPEATGMDAHDGNAPFIMQEFGVAETLRRARHGRRPVPHPLRTAWSRRSSTPLYPGAQVNPVLKEWRARDNPYHAVGDSEHPYVVTTYRLTEHHLSGAMTRWLPWLAELQPELFCELSPELAVEKGIRNGDWVTVETARGEIELKALVTGRDGAAALGQGPVRAPDRDSDALRVPRRRHAAIRRTSCRRWSPTRTSVDPRSQGVHVQHPPRAARRRTTRARPATPSRPPNRRRSARPERAGKVDAGAGRRVGVRRGRRALKRSWPASRTVHDLYDAENATGPRPHGVERGRSDERILRLLHRRHAVHRLQGVRGRVQTMEPAAVRRLRADRQLLRQHDRPLGSSTWRHVAFVEQMDRVDAGRLALDDDVRRLQALHERGLFGSLPDRRDRAQRVRQRLRPAGHLQRLRLLRAVVSVRRDCAIQPRYGGARRRSARSATTARRTASSRPAPKSCPTDSIQFGPVEELKAKAEARVERLLRRRQAGRPLRP